MEKYEQILNLFRSKDPLRAKWMQTPFVLDNKAASTNGNSIVYFDYSLTENPLSGINEKDRDAVRRVLADIVPDLNISIPIESIKSAIDSIPVLDGRDMDDGTIKCSACTGDGAVLWEYSHKNQSYELEEECPVCEGDGYVSDNESQTIKIGKSFIKYYILNRLVKAATILNEESVTLVSQPRPEAANVFLVGNVNVLLMPRTEPENLEYAEISLTP